MRMRVFRGCLFVSLLLSEFTPNSMLTTEQNNLLVKMYVMGVHVDLLDFK